MGPILNWIFGGKLDPNLKSSFPGISKPIPEVRGVPLSIPSDWIEEKRRVDNVGNYWRIHDKIYNLQDFIEKHPGGSEWLLLTRGTDITEPFEASHIINFSFVEEILNKYYVGEALTPRNSPYTFKPEGFYRTLRTRISPVIKRAGTGPSLSVSRIQDALALTFIFTSCIGVSLGSLLLQTFAGIVLTLCVIASHNANHWKLVKSNFRRFYFDLSMFPSCEWRISHVLSHHSYPNTLLDAEISLMEPLFELLPSRSKNWIQKYASLVYSHIAYALFFGSVFFGRLYKILRGKVALRPENTIVLLELAIFLQLAPTILGAILSWIYIQATSSYLFALIGIYASHHHENTFHDGDEAPSDTDFGLNQLNATREREASKGSNLFYVLVSFGDHPLHHLYPTICHSKLPLIKPLMEDTLLEFCERMQPPLGKWELFVGTHKLIARTKPIMPDNLVLKAKYQNVEEELKNRGSVRGSMGIPLGVKGREEGRG